MASSLILYLFCYDSGNLSNDNRKKRAPAKFISATAKCSRFPAPSANNKTRQPDIVGELHAAHFQLRWRN